MRESDDIGFLYPIIDQDLCTNCNLCKKVCPVNSPLILNDPKIAYAATSKNMSDLKTSTSGGAASVIASYIIEQGGVVYGCVQENYKNIKHERIENKDNLYKLKKSKYVHSRIENSFRLVKNDLLIGKKVVYFATPCQIAGLRNYLKNDYENLICVDLVCHGVPSQKSFRDYIAYLLNKNGIPDGNHIVEFRRYNKCSKKLELGLFINDSNGKCIFPDDDCLFLNCGFSTMFYSCVGLRENCFTCPYATQSRVGDLTLGDFWGIKNTQLDISNGISLILCNSDKGVDLIDNVRDRFNIEVHSVAEAVAGNGRLRKPAIAIGSRASFIKNYRVDPIMAIKNAGDIYIRKYKRENNPSIWWKIYSRLRLKISKVVNCLRGVCR